MLTTKVKSHSAHSRWGVLLHTICSLIIATTVNGFTGKGIFTEPSTVQAQKITLEFYATPEITIPAGGWIRLQAPQQVYVYTTEVTCFDAINLVECSVVSRRNSFTITTNVELEAGQQLQFSLIGAIDNPESTMPTDSFAIISSVGETEARDIILTATPGTMNKYILTPESKVVGDSTTLQVSWKGQSTLPRNGYIFLEFPKWNPQNPIESQQKSYIPVAPTCDPVKVLASELSCDFKGERLVVQKAAPVEILPDTELSFTVTGFKNPIETGYVEGFKIWTAVRSGAKFYTVDEAYTSLTVSEYAQLQSAELTVKDPEMETAGMVQETNEVRLDFYLPVPLNPKCKLEVILPAQYSVEDVKQVQSLAVFGRVQDFAERNGNLLIDPQKNSFMIRPCEAYVENNIIATILITNLVQPNYEKVTDTLKIQINTDKDQFVAHVDSGVTFLPFRGPIEMSSIPKTYTVQTPTKISFELRPEHVIRVEDKPELIVEFPTEMKIVSPSCLVSNVEQESVEGVLQQVTPSCQRFQQMFTIKQFLAFDYVPGGDRKIKFEIGDVENPESVQLVEGVTITIYAFGKYAIDEYVGGLGWLPRPGTSLKTQIISTSLIAYENDTTYTINFTPEHTIPVNSYFEISIPTQVFIPDKSFTADSCRAIENSAFPTMQIKCEFVDEPSTSKEFAPNHNTLRISNAFRRSEVQGGNEFGIRIPGLRNPILTTPTSSFVIASFTFPGELIDIVYEGVTIAMIENAELDSANLSIGSYVNYQKTTYTFTLVPTVPYTSSSILFITFPPQIALPETPAELGCNSAFTNLIKSVACSYDSNYALKQTVRIDLGLIDNLETIQALNRFSISMNNVRNPSTTQTTDSIQIRITDSNYIDINSKLTGVTVTTSIPASVQRASVVAGTPQPGIASTFLLDFYPEHAIQTGGGLLIAYPAQTTPTEEGRISVKISINDLEVDNSNLNLNYDLSARAVLVENIVQQESQYVPGPDSKISIELSGLRTPFTRDTTDSFSISTFNLVSSQFYYYIDKVDQGLTINSLCNYPCKTCPTDQPSTCLSCYTDLQLTDGLPFNQLGTCVAQCATSRFYNLETAHCDKCASTCLDCVDRADKCTVCGIDDFLFLHQEQCLVACPDRFIEDPNENACKPCLGNCLTCEDLPTSCTSCDRQSANPFLFQGSCIDQCTPNISVEVDGVCTECDSVCKTCAGTPSTCTSCEPHMRFDAVKKTCSQLCESETQIFVPNPVDPTKSGSCEYCHPNCLKCAGTTETCTLCKAGFVLNLDNTCKEQCQLDDVPAFLLSDLQSTSQVFGVTDITSQGQVAIEGVCALCKEPCQTCEETTSRCTSCVTDYKLYMGSKCVMDCPEKYKEVDGVCVYEGLVCPAPRFKINKTGNGCVPQTFDCPEGYQINDARTACIPSPGSPVPFPYLLTSSLLGLLVVGSYLKEKFETKVFTNLICLVGALEGPMYIHMSILAFALDKTWILVASSIGLTFLVLTNMVFVCYYRQEIVQKDMVFQKWVHFFPKTQTWLPLVTLLVNFKCAKMLYSGFFGLESTQAKFGRMKNFFFIMRLSSYFSFVFVYGPIFVADFLIFADVKWGYQLFILAIETIAIQIFIIVMTVIEFRQGAERLLNPKRSSVEFQRIKPSKNLRVMGGLEEDDDYEEGIPDMDETTLIRSKVKTEQHEISLRQKAFSHIIAQVADSQAKQGAEKATHGDLSVCLTKFDPEQIKLRRAFSMEKIRADQSWEADGESYNDQQSNQEQIDQQEAPQRRYSFPLTPRRLKDLPETELFGRQIDDIIEANEDFLIDNVIAEVKPRQDPYQRRKVKTVSRRTQTYLRELLVVDGEEAHESDMEVIMEDAAEIDFNFAHDLVENVIHNISSGDEGLTHQNSRAHLKTKSVKKKKIFKAKKEIPDFELADIMGDFEIDDLGNFIIMRGENGELIDQRERLVNRRGYLVDRFGNVINLQGNIIFKAIELDIDDEIPAPFGFEKRKKNLMKLGDEAGFKVQNAANYDESSMHQTSRQLATDTDHQQNAMLNEQSQGSITGADLNAQGKKNRSLSRDQQNSQNSQINIQEGSLAKHSQGQQNNFEENSDDTDAEINKVTKKRVAKKKNRLRQRTGKSNSKQTGLNNVPPRRIKMSDVNTYFPSVDIEQDEQRRLAKIASSISGLATQLADKQRNRYHTQGNSYFNGAGEGQMQQDPNNQLQKHHQFDEQEEMDAIRHQTLHEIQNNGTLQDQEGAAFGSANETSYMMLDDRPLDNLNQQSSTSVNFRQNQKFKGQQSRQHSAAPRPRLQTASELFVRQANRSISKGNLPINNTIAAHGALRKVYGNLNDLQFAEQRSQGKSSANLGDSQSVGRKNYHHQIPPRGQSGRPVTRARMEGLEQMYMMRLPKARGGGANTGKFPSVRRHFSGNRRSEFSPFRPLLHQFEDRPAELNIHTAFDGKNGVAGGAAGGRDILEIAENLDKMQRDYLTHQRGPNEGRAVTNHEVSRYALTQQGRSQMDPNDRAAITSLNQYQPNRTANEPFDANHTAGNLTLDFQESATGIAQAPVSTHGNQNAAQLDPVQRGNWVEEEQNN